MPKILPNGKEADPVLPWISRRENRSDGLPEVVFLVPAIIGACVFATALSNPENPIGIMFAKIIELFK